MRWLGAVVVVCAACAGSREVSKLRYTSTDCPDPKGCEATLGDETRFETPDDAHDRIADAAATANGPSCETVAVAMTALELGNYASDSDDRTQVHAKQLRACEAAKLDARETACLSSATNVQHVGYCTRKIGAPTQRVELLDKAACKKLVLEAAATNSGYVVPVLETSCVEDGWSTELAACMRTQSFYIQIGSPCREVAPSWVFDQIQVHSDQYEKGTR